VNRLSIEGRSVASLVSRIGSPAMMVPSRNTDR